MTTYKYVNVNAVRFMPNGSVAVELRDTIVWFDTTLKGTWSRRGTVFRVVTKSDPLVTRLRK